MKKLQKLNEQHEVIAEFDNENQAAASVEKPNGANNILICAAHNHMKDAPSRRAYGFIWRFSA